ncbi:MAG: glutathione transferase GstA [Hyalangium sp.]|uniref:glutathione transferase GstA n=1 Tax=Hyalangium sp. TaxID=2028555 RepID=UPI003899E632
MKLYFAPGACSLNPHILLRESGLKFDMVKVDLRAHKTATGADYYSINPKGYVPALELDNGQLLTENPAIAQYIADQKPDKKLAPANGTLERYRLQEWLGFIGTELHKTFGALFNPDLPEADKKAVHDRLGKRFEFVAKNLEGKQYLMGDQFTAADSYLFVMLQWAQSLKVDTSRFPILKSYHERITARPAVKAALDAENAAR